MHLIKFSSPNKQLNYPKFITNNTLKQLDSLHSPTKQTENEAKKFALVFICNVFHNGWRKTFLTK